MVWNSIPVSIKDSLSLAIFIRNVLNGLNIDWKLSNLKMEDLRRHLHKFAYIKYNYVLPYNLSI